MVGFEAVFGRSEFIAGFFAVNSQCRPNGQEAETEVTKDNLHRVVVVVDGSGFERGRRPTVREWGRCHVVPRLLYLEGFARTVGFKGGRTEDLLDHKGAPLPVTNLTGSMELNKVT